MVRHAERMTETTLERQVLALRDAGATVVGPRLAREVGLPEVALSSACEEALTHPVDGPSLSSLVSSHARVAVIVSDATREEPREEMIQSVRRVLPSLDDTRLTLVIASGTHAPRPATSALSKELCQAHRVMVHDGKDLSSMTELGVTARGTTARVQRALLEHDLIVVTGRLRPHYFAGYSGGVKGLFPGCGYEPDIRKNHQWKAHPSARLGCTDDNECRLDMEEVGALVSSRVPVVALNVLADREGTFVAARAGSMVATHRSLCRLADRLFVAHAPRADVVVSTDLPPVTSSLYQASKMIPPAGAILREGGTVILLADCEEGTGPLRTVNEGIYQLGVRHHLPSEHRIELISRMPRETVETTYCHHAPSLEDALDRAGASSRAERARVVILQRAGELILRPLEQGAPSSPS